MRIDEAAKISYSIANGIDGFCTHPVTDVVYSIVGGNASGGGDVGMYGYYNLSNNTRATVTYKYNPSVVLTGPSGAAYTAQGIDYNKADGCLYIKYLSGTTHHLIKIANFEDGDLANDTALLVSTAMKGCNEMRFHPTDPNMLYYVYDTKICRLDVSDPNATEEVLYEYSDIISTIYGLCFDDKGNLYFTSRYGYRGFYMVTPDGATIKLSGANGYSDGHVDGDWTVATKLAAPTAITFSKANACFYIGEYNSRYVRKYTPYVPSN
jgi:hypothetical protein